MRINNIFSFLKKHRVFLLIGIMFAGFFLFGLESTFAAEEPVISKEDSKKVVRILNGFITGAAALMGMVTSFITMFLYPGWVNGTLFGLQDYLKIMWILVSNIVYFIFAFILIAIAFMNIIGKNEGIWELKQAMPKFIIGVLIVPFSWFFVQFLLSLSAILTVGVLTLPYDSFQGNELFEKALKNKELAGKEICKDVIISFNGDFSGAEGGAGNTQQLGEDANDLDENIKCKSGGKITVKELLTGTDETGAVSANAAGLQNSIFGVMSIYSYGILRIDELDTINATQLSSVKTIADLIFKIVFDVLFIAVYLLLMIALLLALFVRGVRLWVYMMLSPVFGLLYFFNKESEGFGESGKAFNIKEFIALALVPVYVSAALAFGLVFILVASQGIEDTNEGSDTMKAGGFSLTILGAHGDSGDDGREEKAIIGKLVVEIFGIVILWIAVMAALGASNTTNAIVEPIAAFGKSVGDLAAKAPTYAPIIPVGGGQSAASLQKIGSTLQGNMSAEATRRASNFGGGDKTTVNVSQARERAIANMNSNPMDEKLNATGLESFLTSANGDAGKLFNNRENQKYINDLQTKFLKEGERSDASNRAGFAQAVDRLIAKFNRTHQINLGAGTSAATIGDMSNWTDFERAIREGAASTTPAAATTGAPATTGTPATTGAPDTTNNITINTDLSGVIESGGSINEQVISGLRSEIGTSNLTEANRQAIEEAIEAKRGDLTSNQVTEIITKLLETTT